MPRYSFPDHAKLCDRYVHLADDLTSEDMLTMHEFLGDLDAGKVDLPADWPRLYSTVQSIVTVRSNMKRQRDRYEGIDRT